jgi:cell division protein ZapA (FtsZ GTPase activity inhibitor)
MSERTAEAVNVEILGKEYLIGCRGNEREDLR